MSVSLLPSQAKFQLAKTKLKEKLLVIMVSVISVWLVASLSIWVWWIIQNQKLSKAKADYNQVSLEYKNRKDDLLTSYKLKYEAKMVGKVLANRFEYGKAITNINNLLPKDIMIDTFKIQAQNSFLISYSTMDGKNIDIVEEKLGEIKNKKIADFESAKINSLSVDKNNWKFTLEVKTK